MLPLRVLFFLVRGSFFSKLINSPLNRSTIQWFLWPKLLPVFFEWMEIFWIFISESLFIRYFGWDYSTFWFLLFCVWRFSSTIRVENCLTYLCSHGLWADYFVVRYTVKIGILSFFFFWNFRGIFWFSWNIRDVLVRFWRLWRLQNFLCLSNLCSFRCLLSQFNQISSSFRCNLNNFNQISFVTTLRI